MQIKCSLIDPFRMDVEPSRLTYRLERFHLYATGLLERAIDHAQQFFTKGIDMYCRYVEQTMKWNDKRPPAKLIHAGKLVGQRHL